MAKLMNPHVDSLLEAQALANMAAQFRASHYAWDYSNIAVVFSDEVAKVAAEMLDQVVSMDLTCDNADRLLWLTEIMAYAADIEHTPLEIATFGRDLAKEFEENSSY